MKIDLLTILAKTVSFGMYSYIDRKYKDSVECCYPDDSCAPRHVCPPCYPFHDCFPSCNPNNIRECYPNEDCTPDCNPRCDPSYNNCNPKTG